MNLVVMRSVWLAMGVSTLNLLPAAPLPKADRLCLTNTLSRLRPNLPLNRLSSGRLMMLDHGGDLVQWPVANGPSSTFNANATDLSILAALDPRVGLNLQLGPDPPALPSNQRAQAEPHIVRH